MDIESVDTIFSVASAFVAIISVIFAVLAVRRANQVYSRDNITQIFRLYSSETMRRDLQTVWRIYHDTWKTTCNGDTDKARANTISGKPIEYEVAKRYIENIDISSADYTAIENVTLFWDYIALLVSQKNLDLRHMSAFATPKILGFLYPLENAKAKRYGYVNSSLESLYKKWQWEIPDDMN